MLNKVEGVTLSETFRRGSFMAWLLDIENEKKKKVRESEFENHSKVGQNWEQCGFRKILGNRNKMVTLKQLNLERLLVYLLCKLQ